jgi:hypothetical protein
MLVVMVQKLRQLLWLRVAVVVMFKSDGSNYGINPMAVVMVKTLRK